MQHALDFFREHFVTADATVASVVDLDGTVSDATFDLYDQAFALLAYASGHRAFGEAAGWRRQAVALRTALEQSYAHPLGGFREDRAGRLPQCANPHMHLLEAALAWIAIDDDPAWRRMADGIATLCLEKFIDPETGALREFFAADWSPAPGVEGRICEPGHHYEWAFLLARWASSRAGPSPTRSSRLIAFADSHGLDARRGVVINAVLADGSIHDPVARLWAQAERIRAYLVDGRSDDDVAAAIKGLRRFLATPTQGLWFDQLTADDVFVQEPARATSLYHIIGAVAELSAAIPDIANAGLPASPRGPDGASRHLSRDRGLVLHLPSLADGARRPRRGLRGACRHPGRPPRPRDRGGRVSSPSHLLAPRQPRSPRPRRGSCARCASSIAASNPISPITSPCRQPSSAPLPPPVFPSSASTP